MTIIPQPKKFIEKEKEAFHLAGGIKLKYPEGFENAYEELYTFIYKDIGLLPEDYSDECIYFNLKEGLVDEAYEISIKEKEINIYATSPSGAFYAVQSLKQLFSQSMTLNEIEIYDCPSIKYRGFMFDSSRYFFVKEDIYTFLDIMALHKLNVFHWHLTDDQGWRLELYNKLRLAQIGSYRAGTNFNTKPHGGFYTKKDIEDIIEYAKKKYIEIVPEIDSPGHVVSAIAAYPELACFERELQVATHSGVKHDVLCVGKESTFDFMFSVWDEVIEQFKPQMVHLGGDEVPTIRWQSCPHCKKRMEELGFTDASKLHSYYINRLADYIHSKGVETIMWCSEEKIDEYNEKIIKQFWGRKDSTINLEKNRVIDSCSSAYYFDLPYGYISLKDTYTYEPRLNDKYDGIECCLWTEYVPDMHKATSLLFPRIAAYCENAWTGKDKISYEEFYQKLDSYMFLMRAYGYSVTRESKSNPGKLKGGIQKLYFERRQLHWQGLHNILDDKKVKKALETQ